MLDSVEYESQLSDKHKAALARTKKSIKQAEAVHDAYVDRWKEAYQLHRNHTAIQDYVKTAADKDAAQREALHFWKADLHIPLIFSAIETITPRVISRNPTLTVLPNAPEAVEAAPSIKELLEQQQRDIDYDVKLLPTARRGFKYGLGVQKTYHEHRERRITARGRSKFLRRDVAENKTVVTFDGPQVEDVEIADFFWDPAAKDVESARYLIHRTWRDLAYIKDRIAAGEWFADEETGEPPSPGEVDDLIEMIGKSGRGGLDTSSIWGDRLEQLGISGEETRAGREHEILEFHDRLNVYIIVNRQFVAVCDTTPFWHKEMPFQIFRPTLQEGEFVGISEIEPIKHLQYELNTLRGLRLDNAKFVVNRVTFYMEGMVDTGTLKRGPGALIPTLTNPNEIIFQPPVEDIPASSYREEDKIKEDFDRATGIDESTAGSGAAGDTATGIQLIQGAANVRIAHKTRNFIREIVRPAARQFLAIDRQFFDSPKVVRIDDPEEPEGYKFLPIDPETLMADVEVHPDESSTEPENRVQKVNDAMTLFNQLVNNPVVDQRVLVRHLLTENEVPDIDNWLLPEAPGVGDVLMMVGEQLRQGGMPDEEIQQFLEPIAAQVAPPEAQGQEGEQPPAPSEPAAEAA